VDDAAGLVVSLIRFLLFSKNKKSMQPRALFLFFDLCF